MNTALHFKDVTVDANNTLLKDFKGDSYEIVSHFRPDEKTTKVGFNLRVGNGQATKVIYDLQTETLSIDRISRVTILFCSFCKTSLLLRIYLSLCCCLIFANLLDNVRNGNPFLAIFLPLVHEQLPY